MPDWVDGRPAKTLPLGDRGLAYGDGLFETIAVRSGRMPLLERHLSRLSLGGARLALALDEGCIRAELLAFAAELKDGVAKLIVTRGDGLRGYGPPSGVVPRRILQGTPRPAYPATHGLHGVRLFPCVTRLAEQPLLAGLKHLNRLEQVMARAEWQDQVYAEGLMRDTSGRVVEAVFSNLFLVKDGQVLTADLSRCGVAGVMRAELLARLEDAGTPARVCDIEPQVLMAADEVFLCNGLFGVWPVRALEARHWPLGPVTLKLQAIARDILDC